MYAQALETLGMTLPYSASIPAVYPEKVRAFPLFAQMT